MKVYNRALFTEVQEDAISIIESTPRCMKKINIYDQDRGDILEKDKHIATSLTGSIISADKITQAMKHRSESRHYFPDYTLAGNDEVIFV